MIQLKIAGRVISKKNGRNLFIRNGRQMNLPKKSYKAYEASAIEQLRFYSLTTPTITKPVRVYYNFYIKGKWDIDVDNAEASINDVLQKSGIIEDDALIYSTVTNKYRGAEECNTYLSIELLGPEEEAQMQDHKNHRGFTKGRHK